MLDIKQVELMGLGIKPINEKVCLTVESGLLWVLHNTTLKFDIEKVEHLKNLPANVKLFILKYIEINNLRLGILSESISNLSQSFESKNKNELLWEIAEELLSDVLKPSVKFVSAKSRWK